MPLQCRHCCLGGNSCCTKKKESLPPATGNAQACQLSQLNLHAMGSREHHAKYDANVACPQKNAHRHAGDKGKVLAPKVNPSNLQDL